MLPQSASRVRTGTYDGLSPRRLVVLALLASALVNSGCGVVVRGVQKGVSGFRNSEVFHQGRHGQLTEEEMGWAKIAWSYFTANRDFGTGLVASVKGQQRASMWHVADYLAAMVVARELEMIDRDEFDARLSSVLHFLNTMPLFDRSVPNLFYDIKTGRMVGYDGQEQELGWSAIDIGRLLLWLANVAERYPIYSEYIHKVVARWSFCDVLDDCGSLFSGTKILGQVELAQEGRLGYEEYAAQGFQIWGFDTSQASKLEPSRVVTVQGLDLLHDGRDPRETGAYAPILTLPYMLSGLELNWDEVGDTTSGDSRHTNPELAELAQKVYDVQEMRYEQQGIFTARTDHPMSRAPYFVYDSIFAAGYPWNTIASNGESHLDKALVSTRAVFPMWALFRTPYSGRLLEVICPLYDPKGGFFEGRREMTGGRDTATSATTNAVILESLLYKVQGKLFRGRESGYLDFLLRDEFTHQGRCFPREREVCEL